MVPDKINSPRLRGECPFFLYSEGSLISRAFSVSLSESKLAIKELDLTDLIEKLSCPSRIATILWTKDAAEHAALVYKNWLWIIRKYSEKHFVLPPSVEIDEVWHHHIFDTRRYALDCKVVFGRFLHHNPYAEKEGIDLKAGFEQTKAFYKEEFGEELPSFIVSYGVNNSL